MAGTGLIEGEFLAPGDALDDLADALTGIR